MLFGFSCFFLLLLAIQAEGGQFGQSSTAQQFQNQVSTNTIIGGTQVMQLPETAYGGGTGGGGVVSSGQATQIPRNFSNPMILPGVSGPIYYGGPVRFGKELLDVGIIIKFKENWDSSFADKFANNRPGKVNVSESVPVPKDKMAAGTVVTLKTSQPQDVRNFNRSYDLIDVYNVDGTDGADSAKLLGKAAQKANAIGADVGIIVNQGANFELFGKDRQLVIGFSPSLVGGGTGSVLGGAMGIAVGWADHRAKYLTQPFLTVLLFKSTGVPYRWATSAPAQPAVTAVPDQHPEGINDVPPPAGQKLRSTKKPEPSLIQQEKR